MDRLISIEKDRDVAHAAQPWDPTCASRVPSPFGQVHWARGSGGQAAYDCDRPLSVGRTLPIDLKAIEAGWRRDREIRRTAMRVAEGVRRVRGPKTKRAEAAVHRETPGASADWHFSAVMSPQLQTQSESNRSMDVHDPERLDPFRQ